MPRPLVLVPPSLPMVPWPLPAALGLALGIAAKGTGLPAWGLLAVLPLAGLALSSCVGAGRLVGQSDGRASGGGLAAVRLLLPPLLPLLFLLIGYGRMHQWLASPDPLSGHLGTELVLEGMSDGRTLSLSTPPGIRVAISPRGSLPQGWVRLRGTLEEASGARNPGGFDYSGYLRRRGVHGLVQVEELISSRPHLGLRERLRRGTTRSLGPEAGALLEAMTLGVRDELGELRTTFASAGLAHVLALSGLHVGLLMAAAGWLLAPLGPLRYPALLVLNLSYMLLVGATPSVVRAAVMVAVVLILLWAGAGRLEPWPTLGVAALVTLLARPAWLFDTSLQLSYGAVAGILLFAMPFADWLRGDPPRPWWHPRLSLLGSLLTSAAAQALTLPLVAHSFGSVPLLSPLVNVVALPLASLLVPLGFAAGLVGLVSLPLAGVLNRLTAPVASTLLSVAEVGSRLPALGWGEIEPVGFAYFVPAVTALALAVRGLLKPLRALTVVAAAILLSSVTPPLHALPELVVLDVGQGDSSLLRLPGRLEVLVDGGGSPFSDFDVGAGTVLPALRALDVDELEIVVATHADLDHMEGLESVLRSIPVQMLLIGVPAPDQPVFARLIAVAAERGVEVRSVVRGELVRLGGATLEVLNPPVRPYGSSNEDSVALAVYWREAPRALLLGDISSTVESDLTVPQVELLMAPHHGSATSTSEYLLRSALPDQAVVSVGRNGYGHPSGAVLERLRAAGARVHITRESGALRFPLAPR